METIVTPQEENERGVQEVKVESETAPSENLVTFPSEESKENEVNEDDIKGLEEKKPEVVKTGLKIRIAVPKKEVICKEGSNLHHNSEGKKLCSFSGKVCYQKRLENYGFCIKHILEDSHAPFQQCQFISKQKSKQCLNPVAISKDEDSVYCMTHKQALGLLPKKIIQKKQKKPKDSAQQELKVLAGKKLLEILNSEGITHSPYVSQMKVKEQEVVNGTNDMEAEPPSSSSSGSENSSDDESDESSEDSDDFMSTVFMEELQRQEEDEPDYLRDVNVLTEEEVIIRRKQKIKKLLKLYKMQFHRLQDTLRNKHRKFIKKKQLLEKRSRESKRLLKDPEARKQQKLMHQYHPLKHAENQVKYISKEKKRRRPNDERKGQKTCTFERCKGKCMPLTNYCYAHILKDPDQKLFTNCNYTSPSGVTCNYPILLGQVPPYCNGHIDLVGGVKETKPSTRKRKTTGEGEEKTMEPKKKPKEENKTNSKVGDALAKRVQAKKATVTTDKASVSGTPIVASPGQVPTFFPNMQSPVFLPHLLSRGNVPSAVPMNIPQYLNPRLYMQDGMRKIVTDGKDSEDSELKHKMNLTAMGGMARPEAFMHPTFFYHPGLLFNQPIKLPTQEQPPPEGEKKN